MYRVENGPCWSKWLESDLSGLWKRVLCLETVQSLHLWESAERTPASLSNGPGASAAASCSKQTHPWRAAPANHSEFRQAHSAASPQPHLMEHQSWLASRPGSGPQDSVYSFLAKELFSLDRATRVSEDTMFRCHLSYK